MNKIKGLFTILCLALIVIPTISQTKNVSLKGNIPQKTFSEDKDDDVYYEYRIWRYIDLRATPNQPLALPEMPTRGNMNLARVILNSIIDGSVDVYGYSDRYMEKDPLSIDVAMGIWEAQNLLEKNFKITPVKGKDSYRRLINNVVVEFPADSLFDYCLNEDKGVLSIEEIELFYGKLTAFQSEIVDPNNTSIPIPYGIVGYEICEVWFFNKRYSTFRSEIIGICPSKYSGEGKDPEKMGWIPFNDLRRILAQTPIKLSDWHSPSGMNQFSMDAYFTSRLYTAEITQAENLQGKNLIDYNDSAEEVARQREEIETRLINLEEDIWAY